MSHIQPPVVSVIIPVFNKWEYTFKCLMAVATNTRDVAHEVIVVDNASSDDTAQALPLLDGIRFQRNEKNFGFAKACNQGAAMARGKYLMFLNNDTEVRAGWLSSMVRILDGEPDVAMVGSKLLFPDGTLQHAGVVFAYAAPLPVTPFHLNYRRPESTSRERLTLRAVTAACMLVRAGGLPRRGRVRRGVRQRLRGRRPVPQGRADRRQDRLHARERRGSPRVGVGRALQRRHVQHDPPHPALAGAADERTTSTFAATSSRWRSIRAGPRPA